MKGQLALSCIVHALEIVGVRFQRHSIVSMSKYLHLTNYTLPAPKADVLSSHGPEAHPKA